MLHVLKELRRTGILEACRNQLNDQPISEDWRGYAWKTSPNFEGPYEPKLSIDAIMGHGEGGPDTAKVRFERLSGRAYHALYRTIVLRSEKAILSVDQWSKAYRLAESLRRQTMRVADKILVDLHAAQKVRNGEVSQARVNSLRKCLSCCWRYEMRLLEAEIQFNMNRNPTLTLPRLTAFIPFESELDIDGSRLMLSDRLEADGLYTRTPTIIEIKTGTPDINRHRASVAGYSLAYESQHHTDVDFGCVMYLRMRKDRMAPQLNCDVFAITPKFRSLFIERRNDRMFEEQARQRNPGR